MSIFAFAADKEVKEATQQRKKAYAVNRTSALSKMKYHLVCALWHLSDQWNELVRWVAKDFDVVRPGRQFERKHPGKKKAGFHVRYKRTA